MNEHAVVFSIETSHCQLKQGPQPSLQGSAWTEGSSVSECVFVCEHIDLNKEFVALMTFAQGQYKDWRLRAFSKFPSGITTGILNAAHVSVCVCVCGCLTWPSVSVQPSVSRRAHSLTAVQRLRLNLKRETKKDIRHPVSCQTPLKPLKIKQTLKVVKQSFQITAPKHSHTCYLICTLHKHMQYTIVLHTWGSGRGTAAQQPISRV